MLETRRNPLDGHILQEISEIAQIGLKWETPRIQHQPGCRISFKRGSESREADREGRGCGITLRKTI